MNKLRELIAIREKHKSAGRSDYVCDARDDIRLYIDANESAIADLIDAARDTGLGLEIQHPLNVALSKLGK